MSDTPPLPVEQRLLNLSALFARKDAQYGDAHHCVACVLELLLGDVKLDSVDAKHRYFLLSMIVLKLSRYTNNFNEGGHGDSLDDLAVYAQILRELDANLAALPPN